MLSIIGLICFDPSRTNLEPLTATPATGRVENYVIHWHGLHRSFHGQNHVPKLSFGKADRYVEAMLDIEWWHMMTLFGSLQLNEIWLKLSTLKARFGCVDPLRLCKVPQITKIDHDLQSLNQHFCRHTNLLLGIPRFFLRRIFEPTMLANAGSMELGQTVFKHDATVKKEISGIEFENWN